MVPSRSSLTDAEGASIYLRPRGSIAATHAYTRVLGTRRAPPALHRVAREAVRALLQALHSAVRARPWQACGQGGLRHRACRATWRAAELRQNSYGARCACVAGPQHVSLKSVKEGIDGSAHASSMAHSPNESRVQRSIASLSRDTRRTRFVVGRLEFGSTPRCTACTAAQSSLPACLPRPCAQRCAAPGVGHGRPRVQPGGAPGGAPRTAHTRAWQLCCLSEIDRCTLSVRAARRRAARRHHYRSTPSQGCPGRASRRRSGRCSRPHRTRTCQCRHGDCTCHQWRS